MRVAGLLLFAAAAGCHPSPEPTVPPALPTPAERAEVTIHDIDPGVLRGLVTEGLVIVAGAPREGTARVSVCLDAEGMATTSLIESSADPTFDQGVMATVATWRFRPYVRDGAAAAACAVAAFHLHQLDGLPEEAIELPKGRARPGHFAAGETGVTATPGVALAEVCRTLGSRTAPTIQFLQSSGDAAVDRALLDQRAAMPADELAGGEVCRIDAGIAIETRSRPPGTKNVAPRALERRRVAGTPVIIPTDRIKSTMYARRVGELLIPVRFCVARDGRIDEAEVMRSSGLIPYEADLLNGVASWRYEPMLLGGQPIRVCSVIQFLYRQKTS